MKPLVIGLTGGIAAGKSTVASMFGQLGAGVVDADKLARQITLTNAQVLLQIAQAFGPQVLTAEGQLDRTRLATIIFNDPKAKHRLESITHPVIREEAWKNIKAMWDTGYHVVFYEAALLVETQTYRQMDQLLVVIADDPIRQLRLMQRSSLSAAEAKRRFAAQMPQETKIVHANYVIDNSGTIEETWAQVQTVWQQIHRTFCLSTGL